MEPIEVLIREAAQNSRSRQEPDVGPGVPGEAALASPEANACDGLRA